MNSVDKDDVVYCPVCGYNAEGNHYGILSCRSCASFFKRVVEKGDSFDRHPAPLPGEPFNYCNIRENRNACKQCRYLKCLETGMQPSAVQPKREPTGSQSNRKRKSMINSMDMNDDQNYENLDDFLHGTSTSPPGDRKLSLSNILNQTPTTYSEFCRTNPEFQPPPSQKPFTVDNHNVRKVTSPNDNGIDLKTLKQEAREYNHLFGNRLSSCDSGDGEEDSSNDSSRAPRLCHSTRSSSERYIDGFDEYDDPVSPVWLGKKVQCPVCPKKSCNPGLREFLQLVQAFADHTRQMQLSFTSIDDYILEISKGMTLREMEPADINKLSSVELAGLLFWVEKMGHFNQMPDEDQMNLVKRYSVRKLSLDHFYSASKFRDHAKKRNFVLNNYTFVPADRTGFETPSDDMRQRAAKYDIFKNTFERFWANVIDQFITLDVGDAEIVFLHFMLMWSPLNNQFVSETTKPLLRSRRSWAIQMIFEYFYSRNIADPEIRLAHLITLYQEIEGITDQHCADVHVAKLFDFCDLSDYWYDGTCYSSINTDRPVDCNLDVTKLLEMFADLAHNMRNCHTDDLSEILPELDHLPHRTSYDPKHEEPMKIIKWMDGLDRNDKGIYKDEERPYGDARVLHVPTTIDFLIPSTKNGRPIYNEIVLKKTAMLFNEDDRNTNTILSSDVSPEGMKADSPDAFGTELTYFRQHNSDSN